MSINRFLSTISANGGLSFTNNFVVKFIDPPVPHPGGLNSDYFEMFCTEAQLPNTNTALGQVNGVYLGSGNLNYPHTRIYTEIQLGFMCDANLSALKFLQDWNDFIFNEYGSSLTNKQTSEMVNVAIGRQPNRALRLKYRNSYARTMTITKTESGPNSTTQRAPITYVLEQAFPYAIDAVPLQFGSSQLTQVTAQFSYFRHYTVKNDITSVKGSVSKMPKRGVAP